MLKNKAIFKSIAVALIMFMMVAALSPSVGMVYAITGSNGATGTTDVNYEVDQTGWTFSVPAAQAFTKGNLTLYGNVSISPESGKDIISLPSGQTINMTFTAANFNNGVFELRNGSNSVIPYKIGEVTRIASEGVSEEVSDITSNGCTVLTYIAGSSSNEGVTNKLRFATTLDNIKNAKITGLHTDTLTFTVNVSGGTSGSGSESGGSEAISEKYWNSDTPESLQWVAQSDTQFQSPDSNYDFLSIQHGQKGDTFIITQSIYDLYGEDELIIPSDVTLDLRGYEITNASKITIYSGAQVKNGTIRNCKLTIYGNTTFDNMSFLTSDIYICNNTSFECSYFDDCNVDLSEEQLNRLISIDSTNTFESCSFFHNGEALN